MHINICQHNITTLPIRVLGESLRLQVPEQELHALQHKLHQELYRERAALAQHNNRGAAAIC